MIDPLDIPLMRSLRFCPAELVQREPIDPPQSRPRHEPTPDEIAAATAAIRATWSESERKKRAGLDPYKKLEVTEAEWPHDIMTPPDIRG